MGEHTGWPLLMDKATACRYTMYTRAQFNALIAAKLLPPPREQIPGVPRWHREELRGATETMWNLEATAPDERAKAEARRALDAFDPAALRGKGSAGRRDIPVTTAGTGAGSPSPPLKVPPRS